MHYAFVFVTFPCKMLFLGPSYDNKVASQNQVIDICANPQGVLIQDLKMYASVEFMTEQASKGAKIL